MSELITELDLIKSFERKRSSFERKRGSYFDGGPSNLNRLHSKLVAQILTKPSQLTPIVHAKNTNLYRVVIMKTPDDPDHVYTMFVGEGYVRVYSEMSIPIDLRIRLSAIEQVIDGQIAKGNINSRILESPDYEYVPTIIYENRLSPDLDEIGWRYRNLYCVILTEEELKSYKGAARGNP